MGSHLGSPLTHSELGCCSELARIYHYYIFGPKYEQLTVGSLLPLPLPPSAVRIDDFPPCPAKSLLHMEVRCSHAPCSMHLQIHSTPALIPSLLLLMQMRKAHCSRSTQHQHAARIMQHTTRSTQHTTRSMQHTTRSMQRTTRSMQHATRSMQLRLASICGPQAASAPISHGEYARLAAQSWCIALPGHRRERPWASLRCAALQ